MSEGNVLSFNKKKNNRRKLLKEFYKLQESNKKELENLNNTSPVTTIPTSTPEPVINDDELTLANFDEFVKRHSFKTLISKENLLTEELNANQGEIKSIIYNNYYELIKISNYLENLKNGTDAHQQADETQDEHTLEDDDTNFTIGVDDEDEDTTLKVLSNIRLGIASIKSQDLHI